MNVTPVSLYRPAPLRLPFSPKRSVQAVLGQAAAKAVVAGSLIIPTSLAAATAFVGFRLGSRDHGIPSILGYAVGTVGGLATIACLLAIIGVIALPTIERPSPASETI